MPEGKLAEALQDAMRLKEMSLKTLAEKCDATYEHTRKIVTGLAFPSKHMLRAMSAALRLDRDELEALAIQDRMEKKGWSQIMSAAAGKNPEMEPIEAVWGQLSSQHKTDLIEIAKSFAERDRRARLAASR